MTTDDLLAAEAALAKIRGMAEKAKRAADEYNATGEHDFAVMPDVDADDLLDVLAGAPESSPALPVPPSGESGPGETP